MTSEIEEQVNIAIEFFPGRVKRDEWTKQAEDGTFWYSKDDEFYVWEDKK